jgi:hypothetical protein
MEIERKEKRYLEKLQYGGGGEKTARPVDGRGVNDSASVCHFRAFLHLGQKAAVIISGRYSERECR